MPVLLLASSMNACITTGEFYECLSYYKQAVGMPVLLLASSMNACITTGEFYECLYYYWRVL